MSDQSILLTGGHGFVGKHLWEALDGENVTAPTAKECDLRDRSAVEKLFSGRTFDVVYHLAASVGGIGANRARPADFFLDNLAMGLNVIEACTKQNVGRLVFLGTICAYPKFTPVPFQEEDLWNGYPEETNAPYGVAKRSLMVGLEAFRQQYGLKYAAIFPTNLYGPNDNFDLQSSHVIPAIIRKCEEARLSGKSEVTLWGTGKVSRDFLYVKDAARALVLAGAQPEAEGKILNIGSESEVMISDLANLIADATGYRGTFHWDSEQPDGQPRRCVSNEKARNCLGFVPDYKLEKGIQETVRWYREESRSI